MPKHSLTVTAVILSSVVVTATASAKPSKQQIARGEYLVTIMGCNDCHTPLKMGPDGPALDTEHRLVKSLRASEVGFRQFDLIRQMIHRFLRRVARSRRDEPEHAPPVAAGIVRMGTRQRGPRGGSLRGRSR